MDDALGNHKYVTYMKKGAFAQPKKKHPKVVYISKGGATLQLSWTTNPNLWALTSFFK